MQIAINCANGCGGHFLAPLSKWGLGRMSLTPASSQEMLSHWRVQVKQMSSSQRSKKVS
jgi:hypothetical protein